MEAPERIWAKDWVQGFRGKIGTWATHNDEGDRVEFVRADLAQAPVLWTQAQQLAFARAYDAEDAAQRGEPTPWVEGEDAGEWVDERTACVRAGLAALEAPDAGVVAELVEAAKALRDDMLERSRAGIDAIHGDEYRIVNAGRTAWADFCAVLAKLGVR